VLETWPTGDKHEVRAVRFFPPANGRDD
jgi:hypothetical protein